MFTDTVQFARIDVTVVKRLESSSALAYETQKCQKNIKGKSENIHWHETEKHRWKNCLDWTNQVVSVLIILQPTG